MPRPDTTSQVYATATYAKDGGEALEQSYWFSVDTPIAGLMEWALAFEVPGHDLELVRLEIDPGQG